MALPAATGTTIQAADFNTLRSNVSQVLGTSLNTNSTVAQYGYGQTVNTPSNVAGGNTTSITSAHWAGLGVDILKAANHQGTNNNTIIKTLVGAAFTGTINGNQLTISGFSTGNGNITIGSEIIGAGIPNDTTIVSQSAGTTGSTGTYTISSTLSVNITSPTVFYTGALSNIASGNIIQASHINAFSAASTLITTNYKECVEYSDSDLTDATGALITSTRSTTWGSPSLPQVVHSFTITFPDAATARHYFNTGSGILFTPSRSGGASPWNQNTDWTNMLSAIGSVFFGIKGTNYSVTLSGTTSSIGFYNLTSSPQQIYTKLGAGSTGQYSGNDYTIKAYCNVGDNSTGTATTVTFITEFNDDFVSPYAGQDYVDGLLTNKIQKRVSTSSTGVSATSFVPVATQGTKLSSGSDPIYGFGSAPSSISEGSSATYTVNTSNVANGTTLYWTINNGTTVNADFSAVSGSFTINSNVGSFTVSTTADVITEGTETFTISIRTSSISGTVVATTPTISIVETATYSISAAASSVNEGAGVTFNITTGAVADNSVLYWTINNTTTLSSDFSISSGSAIITSNAGSFIVTATADSLTEGSESFTVSLRTGSVSGPVVATSGSVTINDTSTSPAGYGFGVIPTSINEGDVGIFNVTTSNFGSGTLYWSIGHITTDAADFTSTSGSVTITNNAGSFNILPSADTATEGSQSFSVYLRTGSVSGTIVATSNPVTINDTSLSPTYSVVAVGNATSMNEGVSLTFNVTTTSVADNTTLYWSIGHISTASADFSASSGSFTISSNAGSFSVSTLADLLTEGPQTFTVSVRTSSITGTIVATSNTITVNDTSIGPTYTFASFVSQVNEGTTTTYYVNTTNVPATTTLYWTIKHITTSNADFASSVVSGSFAVSGNMTLGLGSFTVSTLDDALTEGVETFQIEIRTVSTSGSVVLTSTAISIVDTSLTRYTYAIFAAQYGFNMTDINWVKNYYSAGQFYAYQNQQQITYNGLNRKPDVAGFRYWVDHYANVIGRDIYQMANDFYFGIGTSDNIYYDYTHSITPGAYQSGGTLGDFIDPPSGYV